MLGSYCGVLELVFSNALLLWLHRVHYYSVLQGDLYLAGFILCPWCVRTWPLFVIYVPQEHHPSTGE